MSDEPEKVPEENAQPAEGEEPKPADETEPLVDNKDKPKEDGKPAIALPKIPSPFDEKPYVASDQTDRDTYNLSSCCCCLCACSHDRVGDASCFGCFPIRCGVIFIGMFIFFLAIILLITTFFGLANEYIPWWFTFVALLL